MIDLSREFQVLAAHLNFTTAARELAISQPGLSRHINELEQQLGFRLLERSPVKLTAAGNHYLEGISQVIERVDDLVAECKELAVLDNRELIVSMIVADDAATCMVYDTLAHLAQTYPDFSYRFDEDRQTTIETAVVSGVADIGCLCHHIEDVPSGFVEEKLFDEPFSAWIRDDNPLAGRPVTMADLSACTIVLSANRKFQTWVEGMKVACERYGSNPQFRMKNVNTISDFLISLQRDETVFISTSLDYFPPRVNSRLVKADVRSEAPLTYPVYIMYREKSLNPVLEAFVEHMRELAARHRGQ